MNEGAVRIGVVNAVDDDALAVRVLFPDTAIVSDWLPVLRRLPKLEKTEPASGGSGEAAYAEHTHDVKPEHWMPEEGETVLCLYLSGFNADGYVLGGIG